jgi:hypothetical protein
MRGIAIPMEIDYIFQKKKKIIKFFFFFFFFIKKKKKKKKKEKKRRRRRRRRRRRKKTPTALYSGWPTTPMGGRPTTYGAGVVECLGVAQATPGDNSTATHLAFNFI